MSDYERGYWQGRVDAGASWASHPPVLASAEYKAGWRHGRDDVRMGRVPTTRKVDSDE